ncbi:hypothetical protein JRO89_XS07G0180700 [Xanthoceras sorbifolium]|uniref:Reverse transcriptase/retrotransposon-derived protein RNase H-like domain-containing protein n=1 Tax=Xanthoceras sorbifolium TaxID=99658 RepID=A0ABQ8HU87_9ROSI|nr:hypothetical protein JRO89_XS07G0180700 [Xanthoceras sorbifolium]
MDPSKVKAILNWSEPKTVHDIRSFHGGLTSFCRRFIKGFSFIVASITKYLKGNGFKWTEEARRSFERQWDLILPQIEFAYNCSKNQSTNHSPFEVVYGRNPISPLDLLPIVSNKDFNGDADARAGEIKKLHAQV